MNLVAQRVSSASVVVNKKVVGKVGRGLMILLGVSKDATEEGLVLLADKMLNLRIFENDKGKFDYSIKDIEGEILVISQFTLCADYKKGRRPNFSSASPPEVAKNMYVKFIEYLRIQGIRVESGVFGEHMEVSLINDGPVTMVMSESDLK